VLENISSKTLVKRVADLAQRMKIPFATATVSVAQSDSVSFIEKKVPAVTIHALSDDWRRVLHTGNDQVTKVNPISVYLAFRLSLALVIELDGLPCEASRGESNPK
jgi:Iap family predicted aminopeptidase